MLIETECELLRSLFLLFLPFNVFLFFITVSVRVVLFVEINIAHAFVVVFNFFTFCVAILAVLSGTVVIDQLGDVRLVLVLVSDNCGL